MGSSMITVLMGAPAAGKSTWIASNANGTEYIYNTEAVRVLRDEIDTGAFMAQARRRAIKAAESGLDIICDGTHTIATHRAVWLRLAQRLDVPTRLIVFDTPLPIMLEHQKWRQHPAPDHVVRAHHRRMQHAKLQIQREGWGSIEVIKRDK
jgi:predicted kinase